MSITRTIGVLGTGTWGTALARMLANEGHAVTCWSAVEGETQELARSRRHPKIPGMIIPDAVDYTESIAGVCSNKDIILFAVPSVYVRSTAAAARQHLPDGQLIVDVAKGIEAGSLYTMSQVIGDELSADGRHSAVRVVALSGPTHAEEVAVDIPTTIVSASRDTQAARYVQDAFMNANMRVYTNEDVLGVELCGAMKNVMALAAGISDGLRYGDNTKAAIITRGMAEITRLGIKMGCREQTFYGLAGIGDLIVTATSPHSRNNRAGQLMGRGVKPEDAVKQVGMVVEGVNALPAAMQLSAQYGVEMPIATAVNAIVNQRADPRTTVYNLMMRERRPEY